LLLPVFCFGETIRGKVSAIDSISFSCFIVYDIQYKKELIKLIAYRSEYKKRLLKGHRYSLIVERQYAIQLDDGHFFSLERGFMIVDEQGNHSKDGFKANQKVYKIVR
jgi:hypothetical protein